MRLDPLKFGVAVALSFAIAWVVCSVLVLAIPGGMMQMTGGMMHADLNGMMWRMSMSGFLLGFFGWAFGAGLIAWLAAAIYYRLLGADAS